MPAAAAPTAAQDTPRGYRGWQSAGCAAHAAMPAATAKGQPTPILSAAANGRASAPALPDCGRKRWNRQWLRCWRNRRRQCCPMHRRQNRNPLPRRWLWKSWNSECGGWRLNWGNRMRRRYFCGRNSSGWGQSTSGWNRNCVRTPLNRRYSPQKIGKHGGQMPAWNSVGMPLDCSCGKYDCFQRTGKYICNKGSTAQSLCGAA